MWTNPQFFADLVTSTEEILHGKLNFLCSDTVMLKLLRNYIMSDIETPYRDIILKLSH